MPTAVRLDAETEALVHRLARRRNGTKSEIIRSAIRELAARELASEQAEGHYEALADLIGSVEGTGEALSEQTGRRLTEALRERPREHKARPLAPRVRRGAR
jgi:predicted transcriptional regulator